MASVGTSNIAIKILAGIAVLFGILTIVSGGNAILSLYGTAAPAENIVPFVLYFNFVAGFAYIVTGVGLLLQRGWAPIFAAVIAAATAVVFLGLGGWIMAGEAFETKTVAAMSVRTVFWLIVSAVSLNWCRTRRARQAF